ncbi:MAG: SAM-dependent methyltransferase [Myxococcota bacterium]|nr:SAM-dependent methyltransferase [Myxococcota bacterium]
MRAEQRSKTADGAAAIRAAHRLYGAPLVFDDAFAVELTSPGWRRICESRTLYWLVMEKLLGALRPISAQVLSRARYAEDCLDEAVAAGIEQYVLIGGGLDSFALRRPDLASRLAVFELDHPNTQRAKRERLASLGYQMPDQHTFVPIDFEKEGVATALGRSAFSGEKRSFFSWLGTAPYLTGDAVFGVLQAVASVAAPGSELVFDYAVPEQLLDDADRPTAERLRRFTERRGEPLVSAFEPQLLCERVGKLGYRVLENLAPAEQQRRYFAGRSDGLRAWSGSYYLRLAVTS